MNLETRSLPMPLEVERRDDGRAVIRGMAALYSTRSSDLGGFVEELAPGAFSDFMGREDRNKLVACWNHNMDFPLGSERAGTLRVAHTDRGLSYEVDPPTSSPVAEYVSRGDVWGSSFSFLCGEDEWRSAENGQPLRVVRSIKAVYELGPVLNPAYSDTSVSVARRSLDTWLKTHRPALTLPAIRRDAATENSLRRFLRQHGRKIG